MLPCMSRPDVAGVLLIGSFALWLPLGAVPSLYRIWPAPLDEKLALIARHRRAWQGINLCIAASAVTLVLGFAALADPLEAAGGGVLVPLSLASLVLGAVLWLASLAYRVTAMVAAAESGRPPGFEAVSAWAGGLFTAWSWLGNLAVAGFGAAIVHGGYPAAWCGWTAIALAAALLVQLAFTGDALPASYHVAPALIGVALLVD